MKKIDKDTVFATRKEKSLEINGLSVLEMVLIIVVSLVLFFVFGNVLPLVG